MTHTPTPAEIETLRKALHPNATHTDADEALAILDRLSPPAPEVDEATRIWREMATCGRKLGFEDVLEYQNGTWDNQAEISYLRTVLSELIVSKDAEIERLRNVAKVNCDIANDCASELAALRAENGRLKQVLSEISNLSGEINPSNYDHDDACELNRQFCYGISLASASLKAAERNTAEPAKTHGPGPWPGDPDHSETMAADDVAPVVEVTEAAEPPGHTDLMISPESIDAFLEANPPVQTAPVVVTQADRASALRARRYADNYTEVCRTFAYHRTEAEARGRREALDAIERLIRAERAGKEPPHER